MEVNYGTPEKPPSAVPLTRPGPHLHVYQQLIQASHRLSTML
jgi:hypothetical protein